MSGNEYAWYKSINLCPDCKHAKPREGKTYCTDCANKRMEAEWKRKLKKRMGGGADGNMPV